MSKSKATSDSKSSPRHFSSNQAFTLPIEAWYLVQDNLTKSELKVILCILLNHFQVGIDAQPLTFGEIVKQTGLSRSSALAGIDGAIEREFVFRTQIENQPRYEPRFGKIRTHDMTCSLNTITDSSVLNDPVSSCHVSKSEPRQKIFQRLLKLGLAHHVAENMALTNRYDLERLQNQLDYIDYEMEHGHSPKNLRKIPGYVVNRIKYDKVAPPGYETEVDPLDDVWVR